ncbi:hypothetical protein Tco_0779367 [Tanacetum coccineum]
MPKLKKREEAKEQVSSVKLGRNKDEGILSEEHHDQDDHNHTAFQRSFKSNSSNSRKEAATFQKDDEFLADIPLKSVDQEA